MDERGQRVSRRFDVPILVAALLVVPVLIVQRVRRVFWRARCSGRLELGDLAGVSY
jgi:hypothetical protein